MIILSWLLFEVVMGGGEVIVLKELEFSKEEVVFDYGRVSLESMFLECSV